MYKLRIWLAYFIMPKDTRKHLIKALSYSIKELEMETTELLNQINAESQESEVQDADRTVMDSITEALSRFTNSLVGVDLDNEQVAEVLARMNEEEEAEDEFRAED